MARLARFGLADLPQHVIQRGHNGQAIFARATDYQLLLDLLQEYSRSFNVSVHSYVLMPNHFHLLLTPQSAEGVSQMLQALGRRYVRHFNSSQGRSGTLWDGRYRSTVLQAERYVLPCMAYIDLNPVRAGLAAAAADYAWSSHRHYLGHQGDRLVTPHALYWGLGNTPFSREAAYAELVQGGVAAPLQAALTEATRKGWALGDADFLQALQQQTDRRVSKGRVGRPARVAV